MPWRILSPERYRIFHAEPLLSADHRNEIRWHTRHLKTLRKQSQKPSIFHELYGYIHKTHSERERHFKEQVEDAIPFHTKHLDVHRRRAELLASFFTKRQLSSMRKLALDHRYFPDYLVYDKQEKKIFFANTQPTTAQQVWAAEVHLQKIANVKDLSKDFTMRTQSERGAF